MTPRPAALLLLLLGAGCATTSPSWLAKVNDEVVTGRELRLEFERNHVALGNILGDEKEVTRYVEKLVDRRLFVQEGYRIGLQETPEVRDAVEKHRAQKMVERFVQDEVDAKSKPTDEAVRAVHAALPDPVEARQLVVATQAEAEAARKAVAGGADLEKWVRERSIAPSAKQGGLIVVAWGADEAYEKALLGLKDGELAPVFRSEAGWEVVRVEKHKQLPRPAFEKVEPQIRRILGKRSRVAREAALYGDLWTRYEARVLECAATPAALRDAAAKKDATPCATWKGGSVTAEALAKRIKLEAADAAGEKWPELRKVIVEDLVNRELLRMEAEAQGYARKPEVADAVRVRQDELVEAILYRDYVTKGIEGSDAAAKAFYDAHPDRFKQDVQLDLAQIVVETPELAKEVEEKLAARQPFAELAAAYSKDERSAAAGGRVGILEKGQLKGEFAPIAALAEGQVSAPLRSKSAFHIVKVLAITPERQRSFDEVREEARKVALDEAKKEARDRWVKTLREAATVQISPPGIKAFSRERMEALRRENEAREAEAKAAQEKAAAARAATAGSAEGATPAGALAPAAEGSAAPSAGPAPTPTPTPAPAPSAGPTPPAATPAAPAPATPSGGPAKKGAGKAPAKAPAKVPPPAPAGR
jgi:parvulin-like peptidyl-prolyl isomerase